MIEDFRALLRHGYGDFIVKVHDHILTAYEPHFRFLNEHLNEFQEARKIPTNGKVLAK